MAEGKCSVVKAEVIKEIAFHSMDKVLEYGPSLKFVDNRLFPGADMLVHARNVLKTDPDSPKYIEPHKHEVDQYYVVTGGLTLEVKAEGEVYEVEGPGTIRIPAGVMHSANPIRGKGYYVFILQKGTYP